MLTKPRWFLYKLVDLFETGGRVNRERYFWHTIKQRLMVRCGCLSLVLLLGHMSWQASEVGAQTVQGKLLDAENAEPVSMAGVFILSAGREVLVRSASDTAGFYSIDAPEAGQYYIHVQRIGYFENETPLFQAEAGRTYAVDIEMRPEPIRIDPLSVTVRNEELERFLTLEFGENPNALFGYRAHQGAILQEAKLGARDNTDVLRRLNVMVSHGRQICINALPGFTIPSLRTQTGSLLMGESAEELGRLASEVQETVDGGGCGTLFLDGNLMPNEQLEQLDMESIAVVVTLPNSVRLYTRSFDWTMRPGGGEL